MKQPAPNHRYVTGLDSPIGTLHGLSKYPYIREARRIIGRPTFTYPNGFAMHEIDVSQTDYGKEAHYKQTLSPEMYRKLRKSLAGLEF